MPRTFLMAGGGTGGHVIPGLAVARELRARGHEVFFVGTAAGMEKRLVPADGFELVLIEVGALARVGWRRRARTLVQLPLATRECAGLMARRKVASVFSMGGYAAGPPVAAAIVTGRPVVVMEPNAVPGFTNRLIGRFVRRALVSFEETARAFAPGRAEVVGLPVREEFFRVPPRPEGETFSVLVTGGSQGSRTLNNAGRQSWPLIKKAGLDLRILHQSGPNGCEALREAFVELGMKGDVVPFISDMPAAFAAADLVVCRSGAGAVSELAAAGRPSLLVPFPYAAGDHQARNAEALARAGAARVVPDADLTGERLFETVRDLAADRPALRRMGEAARSFGRPGAAARAADVLEEVAGA